MSNPNMKAEALWYAKHGIPVFPLHWPTAEGCSCGKNPGAVLKDEVCRSVGKHPRTTTGFKEATTDADQIAKWWAKWPEANVGVPTGEITNVLLVDLDPRNGGPATSGELAERFGPFPKTVEIITGGGGRHLLFRYGGGRVRKELAKGVDLKGDGGYFVAPPSLHASGRRYAFDEAYGGKDAFLNPAPAPQWLMEHNAGETRHKTDNRNSAATTKETPAGAKVTEGKRHAHLLSLAGTMQKRNMSPEAIKAALLAENREKCNPPKTEAEVEKIAESVRIYPPAAVTGLKSDAVQDAPVRVWPNALKPEAYYGAVGEWVKLVAPHTEADPGALLIQFLVAFGNLIGRGAHYRAEADEHYTNMFCVIVGQTSKGRKGSSIGHVKALFRNIDPEWSQNRVKGGLSSGEGLIWAVRDEIRKLVASKERGRVVGNELQVVDEGESDKRILLIESEFASVLQRADREKNTLSHIIRQAWDGGVLDTLVKNSPARATGAHVSIIGHITADELRRTLNSTEAGNGFANRFLWVCSKRSNCLPDGGRLDEVNFSDVILRLKDAVSFARATGRMARDGNARTIWHAVYPQLSEGKPGLLGSVTTRAEAQVLRLSSIYALLDTSATVRPEHLQAALAVWQYCEASARFIFGDALGDATADEILRALRNQSQGMTRTQLTEHFTRNKPAPEISRALGVLQEYGLARMEREEQEGPGRRIERWFAVTA